MNPNPCTVVRTNPHPGRGTVLVLGTPRGGTSVVAGICHMLGIPMGLDIDPSNMEDRRFRTLGARSDRRVAAAEFFDDLHRTTPLAGVKDPAAIDWLPDVYQDIADPVLVVVSRDVYAVAQREHVSGMDFFPALHGAIRRKYAVLDLVEKVTAPLIVVSYERLIEDPHDAIESLSQFLCGEVVTELVAHVASLVKPHADMPNDVNFVACRAEFEAGEPGNHVGRLPEPRLQAS
mgnify:CR=1 FL=1